MSVPKNKIPSHLRKYVVDQQYDKYTAVDQAVWRYVMRQNHHFLKTTAHPAYLDGLTASGISIHSIPRIEEMNSCLEPFGWGAVAIDGYIPGVVFFDFQANGLLPIAADIRKLEHMDYTPAPDIIHEAAGHAPILCDHQYAEYVKRFGEIGSKAFATKEEHEVFEAVRRLSNILEKGSVTSEEIEQAKRFVEEKQRAVQGISEAEMISRLYWWTVEFGMIGDVEHPLIYGAGLLSSVGESANSLTVQVKKIPFDLETVIHTGYDITTMQPQLFVCESFEQLIKAVQEFSNRMAFKVGGTESLVKALHSANTATVQYNSGLQVTGTVSRIIYDEQGEAVFFFTSGPTALAANHKELKGLGKSELPDGFSSPIGRLKGHFDPLEDLTDQKLRELGIVKGEACELLFESGVHIKGWVQEIVRQGERVLLLVLNQAQAKRGQESLVEPGQGPYYLAVGSKITSCSAGAADPESFFAEEAGAQMNRIVSSHGKVRKQTALLEDLYGQVRVMRESKHMDQVTINNLLKILDQADRHYPHEWLLRLEILEIFVKHGQLDKNTSKLRQQLQEIGQAHPRLERLIQNGLKIIYL